MKRHGLAFAVVCGLGAAGSAETQVSRVFVSVLGNDANVCSDIATPCRTIAGGVTQVDAQGEVIIIASGSYAGGTISKAVKINAASGVVAFSGLPITVNPGAGNRVVIRGLTIKAATPGAGIGITLSSGRLSVEATVIDGWNYGIVVSATAEAVTVDGTAFRNNLAPLFTNASGVAHVTVQNSQGTNDEYGFEINAGNTALFSNLDITGPGATGVFNMGTTVVTNCRISNKANGIVNTAGGTTRVSGSVVTKNDYGLSNVSGTVVSFGNNLVAGNTTNDTVGVITPGSLQ
jgi:hypothetical protein